MHRSLILRANQCPAYLKKIDFILNDTESDMPEGSGSDKGINRRRAPGRSNPLAEIHPSGGKRAFGADLAVAVFHAVADFPLVKIQANVRRRFHEGYL
jgi:hypothetical protein